MADKRCRGGIFLLLFFCSGATGLVYEVVWSKFLAQMFGSTIQAQTVVLAVFMGGLALGNRLFGKKSDALRSPVRLYGILELAIGLYAGLFTAIYTLSDRLFVGIGASMTEHRGLLLALKTALAVALLLGPTVLMGGTLPLLAAWLQKNFDEAGRRSARFYAVNSLGAVLGSGLAGFYLVRNLGMVATLQMTALANAVIGGAAILLSQQSAQADTAAPSKLNAPRSTPTAPPSSTTLGWASVLVAISGAVSMGLEVLASRSLSLIFGSSLQSFAVVLMAFILGIGLGSVAISSPRLQRWQSQKVVVCLLLAAALWIGLLVFTIESWVDIYRVARSGLARNTTGYVYYQLLTAAISMIVLGVPAALIGSLLPLLIRAVSRETATLGERVGRLLTWNTLGAVGGVLLTGFGLMPAIGLRSSFTVLALSLAAGATLVAWRWQWKPALPAAGGTIGLLGLLFLFGGESWRHVMSSGAFRARELEVNTEAMKLRKQHIRIVFYEDSADATVSVERGDGVGAPADVGMRINGKTEASSRADLGTQLLVGHLPMLAKPGAKDVFVLGLGSGITAGAALGYPIERLTIAENCEPVIRAARFFDSWNRGVLTNPLTTIRCEDARTILKLGRQKYDVIITQPSNPWMVGVGSVFSKEYYELAASRLKDGGMVAQWFHLYDMHDGIVGLVLRTFGTVFPYVEVWDSNAGDIILLGSQKPWACSRDVFQPAWSRPAVREDLARIGIQSPSALLARQLASQRTAFAIAGDGPIQTDWFPVLEYEAPRAFYIGRTSKLLVEFDERTWQVWNAPADKRQALEGLAEKELKQVFSEYGTVNEDLAYHLRQHFRPDGAEPRGTFATNPNISPCVFRLKSASKVAPEIPESASDETKKLLAACALLEPTSSRMQEGVAMIEVALRAYRPGTTWSAAYYAALAVKASLGEHQMEKAKTILGLGLQISPADMQLHYLQRLVERADGTEEGKLTAARRDTPGG